MPAKRGFDRGTTHYGPLRTKFKPEGQTREFEDTVHLWNPRIRQDRFEDFGAEIQYTDHQSPFINTAANADLVQTGGTSGVSRAYFIVGRAGVVSGISFVGEDGVTQSGTNFLTFTALNKLGAGSGSTAILDTTAHVNTTDTNASALNGGTNLVAKTPYALALSGTAANLRVAEGDVIEVTATASAAGAVVDAATCRLRIATLPWAMHPRISRIAGSPLVQCQSNVAAGIVIAQLDATNEAQVAGVDLNDQLVLSATRAPFFACRFKMSAAPSAVQRCVVGLATAYTATLDNTSRFAWFRFDGAISASTIQVAVDVNDGTIHTKNATISGGTQTLTADTWYTLSIDMANTGQIRFWVDDNVVATFNAPNFAVTDLLQPMLLLQKDSGTGVPSISIDWVRWQANRF